jgi:modulator of FtsH protease
MQLKNLAFSDKVSPKMVATSIPNILGKTYLLLSSTLLFCAFCAYFTMAKQLPYPGPIMMILGMFGLLFLTQALRNSPFGIVSTFAFTGFMGYTLAPLLDFYLHAFTNGASLVGTAVGGTGIIFLALSVFVLVTKKDFTYLGGFLFVAISVAFLASIASIFIHISILPVLISSAFVLLSSASILFYTSLIINGGETNYISATVALFSALFNLFVSLLNILSYFAGSRR